MPRRPGPLQDLPIEHFIPLNPNLPSSRKRPLSPGEPILYSPAKRRILNEEGFHTPKSPLSARFSDILAGPSSPAKKLDFGAPKQASSSRLRATTPLSEDQEMDDYFSQPSSSSLPSSSAPRETPPLPDPQSIHYPGFCVYIDTHTPIDSVPTLIPTPTTDKDVVKENVPPRRKTCKAATVPPEVDPHSQLLSPPTKRRESERLKNAKSTPTTPKRALIGSRAEPGSPTPRRSIFGQEVGSTPRSKSLRRLLADEEDSMMS
ncbi:hypothetical protein DXG01_005658 [Tephrocybe rancida]|nr:hypothetical protein DXG01_005658 [Tephrocybe rancida]